MKITQRNRKWIIGGAALLLRPRRASRSSALAISFLIRPAMPALCPSLRRCETQYNMLKNNIEHFSFKQQWQTALNAMKNANVGTCLAKPMA